MARGDTEKSAGTSYTDQDHTPSNVGRDRGLSHPEGIFSRVSTSSPIRSWMMNWPQPELSLRKKIRLKISAWILDQARRRKKSERLPLSSLQSLAENTWKSKDLVCPDNINLMIRSIVFYDIYSVEEFDKLSDGLIRLYKRCQFPQGSLARHTESIHSKDISQWIQQAQVEMMSAGWRNGGFLHLAGNYCDHGNLYLANIGPSHISLTLIVSPTDHFQKKFHDIISSQPSNDLVLGFRATGFPRFKMSSYRIAWRTFGMRSSSTSPDYIRHRELDELMLSMNKEIVTLFRKYIRAGLSMYGPLPSIEILTTDETLRNLSARQLRKKTNEELSSLNLRFWNTIGFDALSFHPYFWRWLIFYPAYRSQHYSMHNYQILASRTDFRRSRDHKDEKELDEEILYHLRYRLPQICALLSVEALYRQLKRDIIAARNRLAPTISKPSIKRFAIGSFRRGTNWLARLNRLHFQQDRIWSELEHSRTRSALKERVRGGRRHAFQKGPRVDFVDDWSSFIETMKYSNDQQLTLVKSAYEDHFKLRQALTTNTLQIVAIALTILVILLSIISILNLFEQ